MALTIPNNKNTKLTFFSSYHLSKVSYWIWPVGSWVTACLHFVILSEIWETHLILAQVLEAILKEGAARFNLSRSLKQNNRSQTSVALTLIILIHCFISSFYTRANFSNVDTQGMNRPFQEKTKLLKFLQLENYLFDLRTASRISEKKSRETAYWGNLLLLDTVWGSHFPFINDIVIAV